MYAIEEKGRYLAGFKVQSSGFYVGWTYSRKEAYPFKQKEFAETVISMLKVKQCSLVDLSQVNK